MQGLTLEGCDGCSFQYDRHHLLHHDQAPTDDKAALGCTLLALDKPVALEHEVDFEVSNAKEKAPQHPAGGGTRYVAKVSGA